jgi:hypothetical protein
MDTEYNVFCYLLVYLLAATVTANAQQINGENTGWAEGSSAIKTEHVNIDFSSTQKLSSVQNAKQTAEGMQVTESGQRAELIFDEISVPVDSIAPFLAVGSQLIRSASEEESKDAQFQIRSLTDPGQWSEWRTVDRDEHLTTHRDTTVGTLQYLFESTNAFSSGLYYQHHKHHRRWSPFGFRSQVLVLHRPKRSEN